MCFETLCENFVSVKGNPTTALSTPWVVFDSFYLSRNDVPDADGGCEER